MIIGLDASRANVENRTGTERYAWEVLRRLLPLLGRHQVRLYVRESLRSDWPSLPAHVEVRILKWPPGLLWSHLRLSWELFWHQPDVLFVPADTVPIVHPRKTVTTIHDIAFERFPELYRGVSVQRQLGWLGPIVNVMVRVMTIGKYSASERDYHRWSVRHAIRSCRSIITVSNFSKREIVDILKVDPSRIVVTYLGVQQPDYYQSIPHEHITKLLQTLKIDRPFFLYIGRLEKKKNIGLLVRAYHQYRSEVHDPLDLVLVGKPGFGWETISQEIQSAETPTGIHILGWISDKMVDQLQCAAQAFIMLSHYEGFGLPTLQSMSAGVPVLASQHGSLPEILDSAALFVETENIDSVVTGLKKISQNNSFRSSLSHHGRQFVKKYTWESTAEETLKILLHLDSTF